MSNPQFAAVPAFFTGALPVNFNITQGIVAKVILEAFPPAVETTTTPRFYGGCTVLDLPTSSTDSADKDIVLWGANIVTTQDVTATGAITAAGAGPYTLTRVNGSWITDGWVVGDVVSCYTPVGTAPVAGTEGIFGVISAVTATVLTFTTVAAAAWSGILPTAARVCKMHQKFRTTVPLNAGNSASISAFNLLNAVRDGSLIRTELKLGLTEMLVGHLPVATSALPAVVSVKPVVARY